MVHWREFLFACPNRVKPPPAQTDSAQLVVVDLELQNLNADNLPGVFSRPKMSKWGSGLKSFLFVSMGTFKKNPNT